MNRRLGAVRGLHDRCAIGLAGMGVKPSHPWRLNEVLLPPWLDGEVVDDGCHRFWCAVNHEEVVAMGRHVHHRATPSDCLDWRQPDDLNHPGPPRPPRRPPTRRHHRQTRPSPSTPEPIGGSRINSGAREPTFRRQSCPGLNLLGFAAASSRATRGDWRRCRTFGRHAKPRCCSWKGRRRHRGTSYSCTP
jgi:hypothetical protein